MNSLVTVPSDEDILLINAAHVLLENYYVRKYDKQIFEHVLSKKLDWNYINKQLFCYRLKKGTFELIENMKKARKFPHKVPKKTLLKANLKAILLRHPVRNKFFLAKQFVQFFTKRLSLRRKGLLIVFEGVNGTGKSTLSKQTVESYEKIEEKLTLKHFRYYFGWVPIIPITKWLSKITRKKQIYKKAAASEKKLPRFSLFYELLFLYVFLEDLVRYLVHVRPKLRKRWLVVSDRYFYHMWGQYPYSENSRIMKKLLRLFPKPDVVFLLETDLNTLSKRRKDVTKEHLAGQLKRYHQLIRLVPNVSVLKTDKTVKSNSEEVIKNTWKKRFRKLCY